MRPMILSGHSKPSPKISFLTWLLVGLLAGGCSTLTRPQSNFEPLTIHFEPGDVGKVPRGFSTALTGGGGLVSWVVHEDSNATDDRAMLVQESADATNYRFPLCICDKFKARNVAAEVNFKAISGKVDEAGGIVLRYRPENYYIARANALENNVILFKTVNGKRSHIQEVPVKVIPGEWHTLRFEAKGQHLKISFDGKVVLERDDDTLSNSGKVGLWTKADSVTAFKDLKIERVR
jgi:hypothetical protein